MKKSLLLLFFSFSVLFTSCKKDDTTTAPTTTTDPIVGVWVSDGANVAYGLRVAPLLKAKKIVATFNENKTYTVVQTDSSDKPSTFTGTYTITASTYTDTLSTSFTKGVKIYNIVANQSSPTSIIATGIYAISGTNMSYEVIQTSPSLGVDAPTAASGFGSTMAGGVKYNWYIQKYVKQ
ncbi:MAG: hypothetical protein COZ80_09105 [Ignavibacteria bacterium CG_4_8_14_3_um_filter_37_9]|nr:MAG: hypothetical protein COZ80_09105 [Ignavibacteria bacterium CG_4_8_14_3_um_filter_37_9]